MLNYMVYLIIYISWNFMAGNYLAGDFSAYAVTYGDFMAENFMVRDFLGVYHANHLSQLFWRKRPWKPLRSQPPVSHIIIYCHVKNTPHVDYLIE